MVNFIAIIVQRTARCRASLSSLSLIPLYAALLSFFFFFFFFYELEARRYFIQKEWLFSMTTHASLRRLILTDLKTHVPEVKSDVSELINSIWPHLSCKLKYIFAIERVEIKYERWSLHCNDTFLFFFFYIFNLIWRCIQLLESIREHWNLLLSRVECKFYFPRVIWTKESSIFIPRRFQCS